jgi:polar amino acid transport system substrate-binding protein
MFGKISSLLALCLFILSSCGGISKKKEFSIGVDPSWYPIPLTNRESSVTAFSTDLLSAIGKKENLALTKITVNWDDLLIGLQKGQYHAILSPIPPYTFNLTVFDFSDIFLPLGPVLVVPIQSPIHSLDMLDDKEIAVLTDTSGALILEKYPNILIRTYDSIPQAFLDIMNGTVDGAIVDVLSAVSYCQDLYQGILKIATPPLNDFGLRLITLHQQAPDLVSSFNSGLKELKASGEYDKLLQKWNLQEHTQR